MNEDASLARKSFVVIDDDKVSAEVFAALKEDFPNLLSDSHKIEKGEVEL